MFIMVRRRDLDAVFREVDGTGVEVLTVCSSGLRTDVSSNKGACREYSVREQQGG
jgi:hypothetical protein